MTDTRTPPRNYAELVERVNEENRPIRTLILDAETDNLLPMVTTIWVVCTKVIETGETREFFDGPSFVGYITKLDPMYVVFHNGVSFDMEVFRRLWGIPYVPAKQCLWNNRPVKFVDTKLLSQFLNPDRVGGHSLESWGERLGFPKGSHSDWTKLTPEMIEYCHRDVEVTHKTLDYMIREIEEYDRPTKATPPPVEKSTRKPSGYQGEMETYTDPHRLPEYE